VAPTVNAGADQAVNEGDVVMLAGTFSDPGSADTHTLTWQVTDDSGQVLAVGSGPSFRFTPADNGTYTVTFTVTDDDGGSASDPAAAPAANVAPAVDAGADRAVHEGDAVTLAGTFRDPGSADTHTLTWQVVGSDGRVVAQGSGPSLTFTPADD